MEIAELDSEQWPDLVARLGGEEALSISAREHKAFVRARGVRSATDLLRLAFMYGPGGHSLRSVAAVAATQGIADVSDVAILDRLRNTGDWLQSLCEQHLGRVPELTGVARPERPIRIVDGSRLEGPGDRVWRLHLCYDARLGRIADAAITTTQHGERLDRLTVSPNEIRLADRGFPQPDGIKKTLDEGAELLVRLTWNSLQMTDAKGKPLDWLKLFKGAGERGSLDMPVRVHKAHSRFEPIDLRLVIIKKPPMAATKARAKARRASSKNGRRTDARTLAGADHVILLTSLEHDEFSVEQLGDLYRVRWQIELAIKRLKSILHIDRLPAKDPDLARAWLYAHLLFALLLDDFAAQVGAFFPSTVGIANHVGLAHDTSPRFRPPGCHRPTARSRRHNTRSGQPPPPTR